MVTRRAFLRAALGTAAATAWAGTAPAAASRRPNVVYLFSDEHRWQSMSFSEQPRMRTPHLERLASQGTEFTQCISNYPVCSPYRAMMMSGRWPCRTGVTDNDIPLGPAEDALGSLFKSAGYRTAYIGKWHLGGLRAEPFGFDESLVWSATGAHWDTSAYHPAEGDPVRPKGYNATLMTDQALDLMDRWRDEPFLIMVSWDPPHSDFFDAPEDKKALYPEGSLPRRPNVPAAVPETDGDALIWDQNGDKAYHGYHAHISAVDEELGRVMARLEELGLEGDTILIYTSDHGTMMGSHGVGSKRQPYEESIRVPWLVRWPGHVPAGRRDPALFGAIDIAPTLCGLAGIPGSARHNGLDFSARFRGEGGPDPDSQFIMHIDKQHASGGESHPAPRFRGLRTRTHTYAVLVDGGGMLFDNGVDPYQMNNLYGAPEAADLQRTLHARLEEWLEAAADPVSLPPTS